MIRNALAVALKSPARHVDDRWLGKPDDGMQVMLRERLKRDPNWYRGVAGRVGALVEEAERFAHSAFPVADTR